MSTAHERTSELGLPHGLASIGTTDARILLKILDDLQSGLDNASAALEPLATPLAARKKGSVNSGNIPIGQKILEFFTRR